MGEARLPQSPYDPESQRWRIDGFQVSPYSHFGGHANHTVNGIHPELCLPGPAMDLTGTR